MVEKLHTCCQCGATSVEAGGALIQLRTGACLCGRCVDTIVEVMAEDDAAQAAQSKSSESAEVMTPRELVSFLDNYVIGQDEAKKTLAIAVYNHYKRLRSKSDVEISKSNILMIGPTGTGKTLLAQSIARQLNVPFAIADATSLTQAGYVGDDVESIISKLLQAADGDVEKAQKGIVFLDEVDKLAAAKAGPSITRDVSGEGVQQALLKLIEGSVVSVQQQPGGRKHPGATTIQVDTRDILFVCAGAFVSLLEKLNKKDVTRQGIGFVAAPAIAANEPNDVTTEDLVGFGMIREFVGRLPVVTVLEPLDEAALERILIEPKNAVIRQMQELFAMDGATLIFEEGSVAAIAKQAMAMNTGARGARGILEKLLKPALFEVPGSTGTVVTVSKDLTVNIGYQQALAA